MSYTEYENKRSWLIDTAETPEEKANLKKLYKQGRVEAGITSANGKAKVNPVYRNMGK
jgi:hypothetical protein